MRHTRTIVSALALAFTLAANARATEQIASVPPPRPDVIAHRGASGYLPEHTLAAYAMAHAMGADWIEPDLVMSSDGVLICGHEVTLEDTTDVTDVFPDRARTDGSFYAIDFTADELAQLQRLGRVGSDRPRQPGHRVPTFEEALTMIRDLDERTGRTTGIIPEIKDPEFHRKNGRPIEPALLRVLRSHGYTTREDPAVIQSFDPWSLEAMREVMGTDLRLVYLTSKDMQDVVLDEVARYCDGIGPNKNLLAQQDGDVFVPTGLAERIRARGLTIWPWTFRGDALITARFLAAVPVDGFFTDFTDRGVAAADLLAEQNLPDDAEATRKRDHDRFGEALEWIKGWGSPGEPRPEYP